MPRAQQLTTLHAEAATTEKKGPAIDAGLMVYFALWYLGNYYYNITNKLALNVSILFCFNRVSIFRSPSSSDQYSYRDEHTIPFFRRLAVRVVSR